MRDSPRAPERALSPSIRASQERWRDVNEELVGLPEQTLNRHPKNECVFFLLGVFVLSHGDLQNKPHASYCWYKHNNSDCGKKIFPGMWDTKRTKGILMTL